MTTPAVSSSYRQVAENIYSVRLPLPFALDHVNCYLLRDSCGWTILDAGINRPEVRDQWHAVWRELHVDPRTIQRIVLTHMHPDHFGLAGWLQQQTGAPVYLSPRERQVATVTWLEEMTAEREAAVRRYLHAAGTPPDVAEVIRTQQDSLRTLTFPHPITLLTLDPGTRIELAGRSFQAIHAPGHADGQLVFYCAAERLALCGDQVLQRITPNIGVWPTSAPSPLARYLASLVELAALDVALALPGHHAAITHWGERIAELQAHHAHRLEVMYDAVGTGASALEVSYAVFNYDRFSNHEVRFAVAEALAHLEYLVEQGRLVREELPARRIYRQAR